MPRPELVLVFPWPEAALSPNTRVHWRKLWQAKKRARKTSAALTGEQVGWEHALRSPLELVMTFFPPSRRSYDLDNLEYRMKAWIDGMCDTLGINDRDIKRKIGVMAEYESVKALRGGAVEFILRELQCQAHQM